jgi:hypothetical protein
MLLGQSSISVTLTHPSQFTVHNFIVIKYEIIFGGNSSSSGRIFTLQKKIIRIIAGAQPVISCRSLLKKLQILPVPCLYVNVYLWHVPHPTVFMTHLWIHEFYIYIYVCIILPVCNNSSH